MQVSSSNPIAASAAAQTQKSRSTSDAAQSSKVDSQLEMQDALQLDGSTEINHDHGGQGRFYPKLNQRKQATKGDSDAAPTNDPATGRLDISG